MARRARPLMSTHGVSLGARAIWTLALAGMILIIYAIVAALGFAPAPRSAQSLSKIHAVSRGYAIVSGFLVVAPGFVSLGGSLPPYLLAAEPSETDTAARVQTSLDNVRSGRIIAFVDLSTGDGSENSPFYIRTIGSAAFVTTVVAIGALVLLGALFWIAGYVAVAVDRSARTRRAPRVTA